MWISDGEERKIVIVMAGGSLPLRSTPSPYPLIYGAFRSWSFPSLVIMEGKKEVRSPVRPCECWLDSIEREADEAGMRRGDGG